MASNSEKETLSMKTQRGTAYLYFRFTGFTQVRLLRVDR